MFKELTPLLAKRSLVLTLSSVGDDQIRVTITPRSTGKDEARELSQPFAVEGTAEELDNDLPGAIVGYTAEHLTLERSITQVKTSMEAALKEVKEEAAKKVAEARKNNKTSVTAKPEATKVQPDKPEVKKPEPPSLFDAPVAAESAEQSGSTVPTASESTGTATADPDTADTQNDEDEILQECRSTQFVTQGSSDSEWDGQNL